MIIYTAKNRLDTHLTPLDITWEQLKEKLQATCRTYESYAVYKELPSKAQTNLKDVGGFIGGELRQINHTAKRNKESVLNRCLITLDLDNGVPGLLEQLPTLLACKALFYTTHKHCPERPRIRIVIPMTRNISAEEYKAVSTYIAQKIGLQFFDTVSFSPCQLMFYPSTSKDGEFIFQELYGPVINPDSILANPTTGSTNTPAKAFLHPEGSAWLKELERNQYGKINPNPRNLLTIFANDPKLQGLAYDEFAQLFCCRKPIANSDYTGYLTDRQINEIKIYIGETYDIYRPNVVMDCLDYTCYAHAFNPIKDYLEQQVWDGRSRIATLLCDYLGAQDTPYIRAVTTKTLVAAVARIYEPGIKFDSMLVLRGPQGIGKSELLKRLSLGYHTESVTFGKMKTKEAAELLNGNWFVELSELVGFSKADQDTIKNFLSTSADVYRAPYAEKPERHLRQSIMVGTTNNTNFLQDTTGNRRYWPVACTQTSSATPFSLTQDYIGQIWAEALHLYRSGTVNLYLEGELLALAEEVQRDNIVLDDRQWRLQTYLDMPLPYDWYQWPIKERRKYIKAYLEDEEFTPDTKSFQRQFISLIEIRTEFLDRDLREKNPEDDKDIKLMMSRLADWQWTERRHRLKFYKQQRCFERVVA